MYRFEAEVVEIWFSLGAWVSLPRAPAGAVVTSWPLDPLGLDSSFTAYHLCDLEPVIDYLCALIVHQQNENNNSTLFMGLL